MMNENEKFVSFNKNILKNFLEQNNIYFSLLLNKIIDLNKEILNNISYSKALNDKNIKLTEEKNQLNEKKKIKIRKW